MSSRLSCWVRGHSWLPYGETIYRDLFGNQWKLRRCNQCSAGDRILHKSFGETLQPDFTRESGPVSSFRSLGNPGIACGRGICGLGQDHEGNCEY